MSLREYIEKEILPRYENYDSAHRLDHIGAVIRRSADLAKGYDVDEDMVYAIAAYHDLGICEGRELHHLSSARMMREDGNLRQWFSEEQIETMAQAVEDHRASAKSAPRSVYGRIVAEADREIDVDTIVRRTIEYGLSHYPEYDRQGQFNRFKEHIADKYARGGYIKIWIPEGENARRLEAFRSEIEKPGALERMFDYWYEKLTE
ncbi:MAG: HD domain-containing protein [Bacteroidales bacterium]|nr:HD domain-containing protein [Bacteroidales bacterium]MBQ6082285.1 HD domain-containing protein [Bacteroidales bacterium]